MFHFFFFLAYRWLYYWAPGLQQAQLPLHEQIFIGHELCIYFVTHPLQIHVD